MKNTNCKVETVFRAFRYEQMFLVCQDIEDWMSYNVTKVPRRWMLELQEELRTKAGVEIENKQGFIFQMEGELDVTAILFHDSWVSFIQWRHRGDNVPSNIMCCIDGRMEIPTAKQLGLDI